MKEFLDKVWVARHEFARKSFNYPNAIVINPKTRDLLRAHFFENMFNPIYSFHKPYTSEQGDTLFGLSISYSDSMPEDSFKIGIIE